MTSGLFWELMILVVGVWLMVVAFVVYGWLLLRRQRKMFVQILQMVSVSEPNTPDLPEVKKVRLEISKDEPMAKYANFVPEEGVDVSFVDKSE